MPRMRNLTKPCHALRIGHVSEVYLIRIRGEAVIAPTKLVAETTARRHRVPMIRCRLELVEVVELPEPTLVRHDARSVAAAARRQDARAARNLEQVTRDGRAAQIVVNRPRYALPAPTPCEFCGHKFNLKALGKYGCPNCHGEGLD